MSAVKRRKTEHRSSSEDSGSNASFAGLSGDEEAPPAPTSSHSQLAHGEEGKASTNGSDDTKKQTEEDQPQETVGQKRFGDLGIRDELVEACDALSFKHPTPIQEQSIPLALEGRDIIGLAETGSGKTAAFALPILQQLIEKEQKLFALVLAPTRELAYQISQQFSALGSVIRVKTAVIVGGMQMADQAIQLARNPHIVVATPGRLMDHLTNTKGFHLRNIKYLVMDEADRLLELGFRAEIDKILQQLPRDESRRTMLFSATMSAGVRDLQRASLRNPVKVSVSEATLLGPGAGTAKHKTVSTLKQYFLFRPLKDKDVHLLYLLTAPYAGHSTIVFARTINETSRVTYLLRALGLGAIPLHGGLAQSARLSALNKFRAHSRDILVATDVAARGLDIPSVDLIVNYDLPGDDTTYVHRVGRTARAGKAGVAVSFVSQYDVEVWLRIEKALGRKVDELPGVVADEVRVLGQRVGEAQRAAVRQLRDDAEKKNGGGGGAGRGRGKKRKGAGADERDVDEG